MTAGSSVLITLIANEAIMFNDVSSNYSYLLPNLCDKTFLFFDVFIPMTQKVPVIATQMLEQSAGYSAGLMILGSYVSVAALLVLTLVFQYIGREKKGTVEK